MLTTLTTWLRPSSARRPRRKATQLAGFEHLEDRTVPDTTPHNLFAGFYSQDWGAGATYDSGYTASTLQSVVGFNGAGLSPTTLGNASTITGFGPGAITLDLNGGQVAPNALGGPGIALFRGSSVSNNPTLGLKPGGGTTANPFLMWSLDTQNVADVFMDYTLRDIDSTVNASLVQSVALQYRVGNTGPFLNVPGGYTADATTGGNLPLSARLPAAASGQPLVQVRLITTFPTTATAEWIGVDDIVFRGNLAPTVTTTGGNTIVDEAIGIGTTGNNFVDSGITITDSDQSILFDLVTATPGVFTVSILNPQVGDAIDLANQGSGYGTIGITGNNVIFFTPTTPPSPLSPPVPNTIGTVAGRGTPTMTVTLAAPATVDGNAATATAIRALARQVLFTTTTDTPNITVIRTVQFTVNDGRGGTGSATKGVEVRDRNDIPTVTLNGSGMTTEDVSLTLNNGGVALVGDVDALGAAEQLTVTIQNTASGAAPGTLTFTGGGPTVTGSGTASLVYNGTLAQINAAILGGQMVYVPAPNFNTDLETPASFTIQYVLNDLGNTGQLPPLGPGPAIPFGYPASTTANFLVVVPGRNDPPVANTVGVVTTLAAASAALPLTLTTTPPGGTLVLADILSVRTSAGALLDLTGVTLSGSGTSYTLNFPGPLISGTYTTVIRASTLQVVSATVPVPSASLPFTLATAPPGGTISLANIGGVTGPGGTPVSLAGATLTGSGTNYTLTFASNLSTGAYTVRVVLAVQPLVYPLMSPTAVLQVAPFGTVSEVDFPKSPDLNGGILTVTALTNGAPAGDNRLRVRDEGFGPGQIGLQGQAPNTNVIYTPPTGPSVVVGLITSNGTGPNPLAISLNSTAVTPTVLQALLRNIVYFSTTFDTTPRILRFNLTDGDGFSQTVAATTPATVLYADFDTFLVVLPQPINNAPSFTLPTPAVAPTVLEDAGPQTVTGFATNLSPGPAAYEVGQVLTFQVVGNSNSGLFSTAPAIDASGTLTYTPAPDANGTATITVQLMDDGGDANGGMNTSPTQTFTISVTAVNDAPSFTATDPPAVNEDAGLVTVPGWVTSASAGPADESAQTLSYEIGVVGTPGLFAVAPAVSPSGVLTYTLAANANGSSTFEVRVRDNGLTANGGVDVSAYQTFTVTVNPVNDDPVLGSVVSPVFYLIAQPGLPVLPSVTLTDDSADFATGSITLAITGGATGAETLAVAPTGPVTLSGANVVHGSTTVGTVTGGTGGTPLAIALNASATPAVVQDVLRALVFSTPTGTADRVVTLIVSDGDGGGVTATVTVDVTDEVSVVSLNRTGPSTPVQGPTLEWILTTNLPATGYTPGNFAVVGTAAAAVTDPLVVTQLTNTTVQVTANVTAAVLGTIGLNLVNDAGLSVGIIGVPPDFVGQVYAVDRVGPEVSTITNNDTGGDNTVPVNQAVVYTITFAEDVQNGTFTAADLNNLGTAPVSFGLITETAPGVFTVSVTPTGPGTIRLEVPTSATILDALNNDSPAGFVDAITLTVDPTQPTVVSVANNTASTPPNVTAPNTPVTFTVTFSEDIDAATLAGTFTNAGTAPATIGTPVETGIPGVVTVTMTPTGTGTLVVSVAGVRDVAGNPMVPFTDTVAVTSNLPPTPLDDTYTLTEDGGTFSPAVSVLANDTDPGTPPQALTADTPAIQLPTKGTLVLRADGTFDYTPDLDAFGTDTFRYRVRDPFGGTNTATVTLNITPVNDPPTFTVAVPSLTVLEDSPTSTGTVVLTNILPGPGGETEGIASIQATTPQSNLFAVQPRVTYDVNARTGVLSFTPAPNQYGTALVTVTVTDAGGGTNSRSAQFSITITPVNDAPTLILSGNPPVAAEDGGPQVVPGFASFLPGPNEGGLGQTASYTAVVTGTSGGLTFVTPPSIDATGTLRYQSAPDSTGTATVQVSVRDSGGTANGGADAGLFTQTFTIVVRSQNDLPIANPDGSLVPKDAGPTFINALANDSPDPDGSEVLTVVSVSQPANGTAAVAPGGRGVLYTPAPGFTGTDSFTYTINDGNGGPATSTVSITVRPVPAGQPLFDVVATGTGPGGGPVVRVNSLSTGAFTATFAAYDPNFRGGVNVAVGDVSGDGVPDVVVTPGVGGGPHVKVIDGTKLGLVDDVTNAISERAVLASFFAYDPGFRGGVTVTVADVDGDGRAEIITGTGPGGGAHVKVISGLGLSQLPSLADGQVNPGAIIGSFFAYDPRFTGGVNVAAGDVNGDGRVDIVTASGAGGGSHVKVFSGLGGPLLQSFFAYGADFRGGVNIAAGDVNGDGLADIITGAGVGGGPHIKVFDARGGQLASFFGLSGSAAGADVAYRVTKDAIPLVVVGGQTGGSQVRTYAAPNFDVFSGFDAYEPTFLGGVEVG